jgi:hypothetical protein
MQSDQFSIILGAERPYKDANSCRNYGKCLSIPSRRASSGSEATISSDYAETDNRSGFVLNDGAAGMIYFSSWQRSSMYFSVAGGTKQSNDEI